MTKEKKADMEAATAEFEHEIHLAVQQGAITDKFDWQAIVTRESDGEPFIVLLTVGRVRGEKKDGEKA